VPETFPEAIRRYFHGVNEEDWEDFRGIWHDDAVIEVVGGVRVQGWSEILPYYTRALSGFPVHHDDPYRVHVAGDTVTVEIAFAGETVEGVPTAFEAVDVFTLEDGRVRRLTTWYDLDRVVGFLRTPGAPGRRLQALVHHAATSSPYYRRRFEELGLSPGDVESALSELPVTRLEDIAFADLVAVPEHEIVQVDARGREAVPLARADLAERGRSWDAVLRLAGIGREDTVLPIEPSPGIGEAVARVRARLAYGSDPALARATVAVHPLGEAGFGAGAARTVSTLERPEAGMLASTCSVGTIHAHTGSHIIEIEDGELVVTPLGARALPLLRYGTGIGASWLVTGCTCDSELPALILNGWIASS
jgi:ketosteroid isomerase-like protein